MNIQEPKYAWARLLTVRRQTCRIILHHAAADGVSALDIHRQHRANGWAGIGYHYYVPGAYTHLTLPTTPYV